jgi:hypothetical protein
VVAEAVQLNVPNPPFLICTVCLGGVPPGTREKLNVPGRLSRKVAPGCSMVKVTGTVSAMLFDGYSLKMISPV